MTTTTLTRTTGTTGTTVLSTSDVESRRGFDYWTEAVSSTFVPARVPDPAPRCLPR